MSNTQSRRTWQQSDMKLYVAQHLLWQPHVIFDVRLSCSHIKPDPQQRRTAVRACMHVGVLPNPNATYASNTGWDMRALRTNLLHSRHICKFCSCVASAPAVLRDRAAPDVSAALHLDCCFEHALWTVKLHHATITSVTTDTERLKIQLDVEKAMPGRRWSSMCGSAGRYEQLHPLHMGI